MINNKNKKSKKKRNKKSKAKLEERKDNDTVESNVTKDIRETQMADLVKKNEDRDLDSVDNNSEARRQPKNVTFPSDDKSVASSLTNLSMESTDTTYSDVMSKASMNSQSDGSNVTLNSGKNSDNSSKRNKYDLTNSMIELIATEGMNEEGVITAVELEKRVLAYQQLQMNEARGIALEQIAKYANKNLLAGSQPTSPGILESENQTSSGNKESTNQSFNQSPSPLLSQRYLNSYFVKSICRSFYSNQEE